MILQNPELPLLVFAGEDSNNGEWGYMSCSSVKAAIGEFLDCEQTVNDERCFTDRDDFQEEMEDKCDFTGTDEEFAEYINTSYLFSFRAACVTVTPLRKTALPLGAVSVRLYGFFCCGCVFRSRPAPTCGMAFFM